MTRLAEQRCFNHAGREAAALCIECRRHYCRECVTEYKHRVICASCLERLTQERTEGRNWVRTARRVVLTGIGIAALWLVFYLTAQALLSMPSEFHEGSLWSYSVFEQE